MDQFQYILCHTVLVYSKDDDRKQFDKHMSDVHGAVYNTDFIFASCRVDDEFRKSLVKTITHVTEESTESVSENLMTDDLESYHASKIVKTTCIKQISFIFFRFGESVGVAVQPPRGCNNRRRTP